MRNDVDGVDVGGKNEQSAKCQNANDGMDARNAPFLPLPDTLDNFLDPTLDLTRLGGCYRTQISDYTPDHKCRKDLF